MTQAETFYFWNPPIFCSWIDY